MRLNGGGRTGIALPTSGEGYVYDYYRIICWCLLMSNGMSKPVMICSSVVSLVRNMMSKYKPLS